MVKISKSTCNDALSTTPVNTAKARAIPDPKRPYSGPGPSSGSNIIAAITANYLANKSNIGQRLFDLSVDLQSRGFCSSSYMLEDRKDIIPSVAQHCSTELFYYYMKDYLNAFEHLVLAHGNWLQENGGFKSTWEVGASKAVYAPYIGRDFVHSTWCQTYAKISHIIGVDVCTDPTKYTQPRWYAKVALDIISKGWGTGVSSLRAMANANWGYDKTSFGLRKHNYAKQRALFDSMSQAARLYAIGRKSVAYNVNHISFGIGCSEIEPILVDEYFKIVAEVTKCLDYNYLVSCIQGAKDASDRSITYPDGRVFKPSKYADGLESIDIAYSVDAILSFIGKHNLVFGQVNYQTKINTPW